ncbi:hypothetical protein BDZ91DRAFT_721638 [Kalaharituber pfeilii]|nr:hypothetical protein BDZ91DRAFT_721638 [Kalaharituber pfeilii]
MPKAKVTQLAPQSIPLIANLRLYRAILREISYHFDSFARKVLSGYARRSFESHKDVVNLEYLNECEKKGRKFHSVFVRANVGEPKSSLKVLRWTYGRTGKRGRELLQSITTAEREPPLIPGDSRTAYPKILPALEALCAAQPSRVKSLYPAIPETNIHGEAFSKNREANMRRTAYREALRKVYPPTPDEEFIRLEKLVMGEIDEPLRERRPRPEHVYSDKAVARREEILFQTDAHHITKQYKRRLYAQVLAESPRLFQDENGKWIVEFSRVGRGLEPIEGAEEEFDDLEEPKPGMVDTRKQERSKIVRNVRAANM